MPAVTVRLGPHALELRVSRVTGSRCRPPSAWAHRDWQRLAGPPEWQQRPGPTTVTGGDDHVTVMSRGASAAQARGPMPGISSSMTISSHPSHDD